MSSLGEQRRRHLDRVYRLSLSRWLGEQTLAVGLIAFVAFVAPGMDLVVAVVLLVVVIGQQTFDRYWSARRAAERGAAERRQRTESEAD